MNAIIFDLDGVLCHTDEYHYMAWKAIEIRFIGGCQKTMQLT